MMALRQEVLDAMGPRMTEVNERREAFKGKQMDRLGQELELARQLVAECGVELQLAVRALRWGEEKRQQQCGGSTSSDREWLGNWRGRGNRRRRR